MRAAKKYLVEEVTNHLSKSDYVFLANYDRITVGEVSDLRDRLSAEKAEFHVVKNSVLKVAAKSRGLPDLDSYLTGPTAIVVGGQNPSGVAKIVQKFFDEKNRPLVKVGILGDRAIDAGKVKELAELPSIEVLQAQLLGLFSQPAQSLVRILNAVPAGVVNVLQAKVRQAGS
jgi:large subunit ribosomal protein L10